jgi:Type I restriction modification DNA specificity domain
MELDLKNIKWGEFTLGNIFKVTRGKRLTEKDRKKGNLPYYSASSSNNGLTDFISNPLFIAKDSLLITTFFDAFYVKGEFTASDEISILSNNQLNEFSGRFISKIIYSNKDKFAFGHKAFTERIKRQIILLPINKKGEPDYLFMEQFMQQKEKEKLNQFQNYISKKLNDLKDFKEVKSLNNKDWEEFEIRKIFIVKSGTRLTKSDMKKGNIPFVGATDSNNGITEFISNKNASADSNVLGVNYNGSVVENFYHPYIAIFSDDVKRLSFREVKGNKYLFLFVKNQILKQKDKYQYGYKFNGARMNKQKITLPVNSEKEPDYEFMENYIKKIEFEKLNKYMQRIKINL